MEDIVTDTTTTLNKNDDDFEDENNSVGPHVVAAMANEDASAVVIDESIIVEFFDQADKNNNSTPYTNKASIKWRRKEFVPLNIPSYNAPLTEYIENNKTPYEYFRQYFTEDLFEAFAYHTNLYAEQKDARKFKHTDKDEIKKLFGLHVLIGCMKFSRLRLYWDPVLGIQAFKNTMTCDRFSQLRNNLHVVNNLEVPAENKDKFIKVRPVIDAIRNRCLQLTVEEVVSVDEQIIPYTGQLSTKQYMKGKPNPWGIKVYVLAGKAVLPVYLLQVRTSMDLVPRS